MKSQASKTIPTTTPLPIGLVAASAISLAAVALRAVSKTVICVSLRLAVCSVLSPVADGFAAVPVSENVTSSVFLLAELAELAEETGMLVKLLTLMMDEVVFAASGTASMLQVAAASETESP